MAVEALGYIIIDATDRAKWQTYLTEVVGVMESDGAPEGSAFYRIDGRPFRFWVRDAEQDMLAASAYEVTDAASLETAKQTARDAGQAVEDGSAEDAKLRGVEAFFRTSDPAGNGLEFFYGESRDDAEFQSPAGVSGFVTGELGMGHSVLAAPDFAKSHEFYKALGFADTDIPHFKFSPDPDDPGMRFAFMHAKNGRHHSLAIGEMPQNPAKCVHLMLEMKTQADVGKCHDRMKQHGVSESASIGRHVNDQTFGFYMQTPGGFDLEIGCDPLIIDPEKWEPTAHLQPSEWGHEWAWQKALAEEAAKAAENEAAE